MAKIILLAFTLLLPLQLSADGLTFQVVEKDFSLTPNLVATIQKSDKNPHTLYITFTKDGLNKFNQFIENSVDKKLNIVFNDKVISLAVIKTTEFPISFYLNAKDQQTTDEILKGLSKH